MEWIQANLGTIIVSVILAAIVAGVIASMIIRKRNIAKNPEMGGCGGGCADCPMRGSCH